MKTIKNLNLNVPILLSIVCVSILSGVIIGYCITSSQTLTISGGVYPRADYTVWLEGSTYFTKDRLGNIPFSDSNKTAVIEYSISALTSGGTVYLVGLTMNSSISWDSSIQILEDGVEYFENMKYKLYVAMTSPATVGYFYGTGHLTANETTFIFSSDYMDVGVTSTTTPFLNMPAVSLNNLDYPIGITIEAGETVCNTGGSPSGGCMYVELSMLDDITSAKALWFRRMNYLTTTTPTRYKVFFEAAQDREYTDITVTGNALLGMVSYNAILGGDLFLNDSVTEKNMFALAGASYSGPTPTWDYGYINRIALAPMRPVAGWTWQLKAFSAAMWSANVCNLYFEVYDDLPAWW